VAVHVNASTGAALRYAAERASSAAAFWVTAAVTLALATAPGWPSSRRFDLSSAVRGAGRRPSLASAVFIDRCLVT
jgi:hypothetical protein